MNKGHTITGLKAFGVNDLQQSHLRGIIWPPGCFPAIIMCEKRKGSLL
jgi:hypothetical protein